MIEDFEQLDCKSNIELLEEGVYLERFSAEELKEAGTLDEAYYYGDLQEGLDGWCYDESPENNLQVMARILQNQLLGNSEILDTGNELGVLDVLHNCSIGEFIHVLKIQGINIEAQENVSLRNMMELLESDGKVLCSVNEDLLRGLPVGRIKGLSANRLIEVISIDINNPIDIKICFNNPTDIDGHGKECSWDIFNLAWETSGRQTWFAYKG